MMQNTKKLKLHHGIILIVLAAIDIFFIGDFLGLRFGLYGTLISELILLILSVAVVLVFHGNLRHVFPIGRVKMYPIFGTLVIWMGTISVAMVVSTFMMLLFPEQMMRISAGLNSTMTGLPFVVSFIIVAISPAICEEAVFRGVFFNSLWAPNRNKWIPILVTAAVFGAFHGSIWRFFPTFILGAAMGYILMETGNMFYTMLFHALNNGSILCLAYFMQSLNEYGDIDAAMQAGSMLTDISAYTLIAYMIDIIIFGISGTVLLLVGSYLLHGARIKSK